MVVRVGPLTTVSVSFRDTNSFISESINLVTNLERE